MNPSSNQAKDDELQSKISDQLANLMVKASIGKLNGKGDLIEQGKKYIAMHSAELKVIMALIKADRLQGGRKAQVATMQQFKQYWSHEYDGDNALEAIELFMAELEGQGDAA